MPDLISTKGAADANAYCDADFAGEFLDNIYGADSWSELSADDQDRLLITATRMIDELNFELDPATGTQALKFPLLTMTDAEFLNIKEATALQASFLLANMDAIKEAQTAGIIGVKSEGLSGMSRVVTGYNPFRRYSPEVIKLLKPWIDFSFKVGRG